MGARVVDHFYWLCRETAVKTARRKGEAGAGQSQDDRTAQDLDLTPKEEQFLARQVNVLCVCAQMMAIVCAWVQVLLTIFTGCGGKLQSRPLGAKERPVNRIFIFHFLVRLDVQIVRTQARQI